MHALMPDVTMATGCEMHVLNQCYTEGGLVAWVLMSVCPVVPPHCGVTLSLSCT